MVSKASVSYKDRHVCPTKAMMYELHTRSLLNLQCYQTLPSCFACNRSSRMISRRDTGGLHHFSCCAILRMIGWR